MITQEALALRARSSGRRSLEGAVGSWLREHGVFLSLVFGYVFAVWISVNALGRPEALSLSLYSPILLVLIGGLLVGGAIGYAIYFLLVLRPRQPFRQLREDLGRSPLTPIRLAAALPVLLAMPIFMSAFTSMKVLIPAIAPFSWDLAFMTIDRNLHGGVEPWRLLYPLFGTQFGTAAINLIYHKWFIVLNGVLIWQAFSVRRPELRRQFFVAFVLVWILLGTVMALLLPAAGPCYYGRVTAFSDPYAPLMSFMNHMHSLGWNPAFAVQEHLWAAYASGNLELGGGISAMPSMHVAMAVLFVLLGYRHGRMLGTLMLAFAIMILLGSVYLGWHYAIDGYAAIPGVLTIWHCVGKFSGNHARRR